ncbi:PEP-CTERM sorting domain-containing protein [Eleftheria terrae]|uniref:PEP-CTERM sorting domain-containing protein n=1 Tax=Eleftheria terrae TaxID=1597781 RepID=UPI00263B2CB8|nr:PEP-CTERM sorting domain-containing protein [Eleftheria terrae]WKB55812.1 PEP-CTERM sorting domain-containing protein [Eleftheria terrae]
MRSNLASLARPRLSPGMRRVCRSGPRRAVLAAAAAQLFLHAGGAMALDTRWTGQAGPEKAFWDLASNWSAGLPASPSTAVLLGASHTTVRDGAFQAATLHGTGTLRLSGGSLELAGAGSRIGRLELLGGSLGGLPATVDGPTAATLTVDSFLWQGGRLDSGTSSTGPQLTVLGETVLAGPQLSAGSYGGQLAFNGTTRWQDGASEISGDADLHFGAGGQVLDEARTGLHHLNLMYGQVTNAGSYRKTGGADTLVESYSGGYHNSGTMQIDQGRWSFSGYVGATWLNTGRIDVASEMSLSTYRGDLQQNGTLNVLDGGKARFAFSRTGSTATGQWNIAKQGSLEFVGADQYPDFEGGMSFAGTVYNEGVMRLRGGQYSVQPGARLHGQGRVEVLDGAAFFVQRDLDIGALRIADPYEYVDSDGRTLGYGFSSVRVNGKLTLDIMDWADGDVTTTGPVTVRGRTTLSNNQRYWWADTSAPPPTKKMNTAFDFQGGVHWDGNADITGTGSIRVRAGTTFEDHNSVGTYELDANGWWYPRATMISVASFLNEGRYLKTGAGQTTITADFDNRGTVSAVNAGTLRLNGKVNNTGTLETNGGRLVVWGPLAQYSQQEFAGGLLSGGTYVVRNGTLALNLGSTKSGTRPALINTIDAGTTVVLDGPQAKIVNPWQGSDVDALSQLSSNRGSLSVLNGATLSPGGLGYGLGNGGTVYVGAGSTLRTGSYDQWFSDWSATWLGGTIDAGRVALTRGVYSAGAQDEVGTGHLVTQHAELTGTLLLDIDSAELYDRLFVKGQAKLGGELKVAFEAEEAVLGSFHFLTIEGGMSGSFASVTSNLDPSLFRLTVSYAGNDVILTVAQVPEPETYALFGLGLAGLAAWTRRRQKR